MAPVRALHSRTVSASEEPRTERRWKTFADVVAFTLGTNVWISIVILPAIFVNALNTPLRMFASITPFAALIVGLWRRSELILMALFPSLLLLPNAELRSSLANLEFEDPLPSGI